MAKIAVLIVNWNTRDYLVRCLEALEAHRGAHEVEVWVVDNASTDDSVCYVKQHFPSVHLIENSENIGFTRANNQAYSLTSGDYVLLLNSDAFILEGALDRLVEVMERYPDTGIAGAQLYYEDGSLQPSCYAFPTLTTELWQTLWLDRLFPKSRVFGKYLMTFWSMDDLRVVDWLMGSCMLVRRSAIEQIGLFDESYFMYSEETDLCYRMQQAGWKTRYVPSAKSVHVWGGSSNQVGKETLVRLYQSRVLFFRKHYGAVAAALYKLILRLNSLLRSIAGSVGFLFLRKDEMLEKTRSYWHLFRMVRAF